MNARSQNWGRFGSGLVLIALVLGLVLPTATAGAAQTTVLISVLEPSWTAPGGGGVWSGYYGPPDYLPESPGATAIYDGREAGIIKAGLTVDPVSGVYEDDGIFSFKPAMTTEAFAAGVLTYDVQNQYGPNPVWMTIEIDTGIVGDRGDNTVYQYVPPTNPAGWHTVNGNAGQQWLRWATPNAGVPNGDPAVSLAEIAGTFPGDEVMRANLRLGMGNSYHPDENGTVGWVDKMVIGETTYDFVASVLDVTNNLTVTATSADWGFVNDNGTIGDWTTGFASGPASPPLGLGSAHIALNSTGAGIVLVTQKYQGTPLGAIRALSFSTYTNQAPQAMTFQINYDPDVRDVEATTWYGRLTYEPYMNGTVTADTWQTWDAVAGGTGKWWASPNGASSVDDACPQSSPCTFASLLTQFPYIGIRNDGLSAIQFKAGSGWDGFDGNIDNLNIQIAGVLDVYDFEPVSTVYVDDDWAGTTAGDDPDGAGPAIAFGIDAFDTVKGGISAAADGGTVHVAPGSYEEAGQILIDKDLTIVGDAGSKPVIQPTANLPFNNNAGSAWWLIQAGNTFNLSDVVLDGAGFGVWQGVRNHGFTTIDGVDFLNIKSAAHPYMGFAVASFGGIVSGGAGSDSHGGAGGPASTLTVTDSTFSNIGRIGILIKGTQATATITGNTYTGKGDGNWLDYAVEVGAGGTATISGNTISGNTGVASTDGSTSAGILVTTYYGAGTNATITGNTISGNTTGVAIGYNASDTSVVTFSGNTFADNEESISSTATGTFDVVGALGGNTFDKTVTVEHLGALLPNIWSNIQDGIDAAVAGDIVHVSAGEFVETGQIVIDKNLSIVGADKTTTIIKPAQDTAGSGDDGSWFLVNDGITFNLSKVTLDGVGRDIRQGIRYKGSGTVDDVIIQNMVYPGYLGWGIAMGYNSTTAMDLTVTNSQFINFGRVGILADEGAGAATATITNNTFTCKGVGDHLDYAIEVGGGAAATITGNTITGCAGVASSDGSTSAGIYVHTYFAPGTTATISGNSITGGSYGIAVGYNGSDTAAVTAFENQIYGNTGLNIYTTSSTVTVDAEGNWYGSPDDPAATISGLVDDNPWCGDEDCTWFVWRVTPAWTIQAAIDAAAPGDTILVGAGTYVEQLTIEKNLKLIGEDPDTTIVQSPTTLADCWPTRKPIICVENADADIMNLTVDGATRGISGFIGVGYHNASGTIASNVIRNVRSASLGAANGVGIFAQNEDAVARTIEVTNNTINEYDKNGTAYRGDGLTVNSSGNTVTGAGPTGALAQNGFQYSSGAVGSVTNNSVGNHFYTGNSGTTNDPYTDPEADGATGILLYGSGAGVNIGGNVLDGNQFGIWTVGAPDVDIHDNTITGLAHTGFGFPTGIAIFSKDQWSDWYPVSEAGTVASIDGNTITNHDYGVIVLDYVAGAPTPSVTINNNTFTNNHIQVATTEGTTVLDDGLYNSNYDKVVYVDHPGSSLLPVLWSHIQDAVDAAVAGDLVHAMPGTYIENVVIDTPLHLEGSGQDVDGTIILPALSAPNPCSGSSLCPGGTDSNVILVQANDVEISELSINGDNPALTSTYDVGGANLDARNGIITDHRVGTYNGLNVHHVTVQNIYLRGIYGSTGTFNFDSNTVTNVQAENGSIAMFAYYGPGTFQNNNVSYANDAISANWSKGINFLNNTVTHSASGIHTDNAGSQVGAVADLIEGNTIDCTGTTGAYGIWVFVPYIGPTFNNNTVTNCNVGISAWGQARPVTTEFTNNVVTGAGEAGSVGAYITTDQIGWGYNDVSVLMTGNVITNFENGIYLTADAMPWTPGWVSKTVTATLNLNQIFGNTNGEDKGTTGTYVVDVDRNWWGAADGPGGFGPGSGDEIVAGYNFLQWCGDPGCTFFLPPPPAAFSKTNPADARVGMYATVTMTWAPSAAATEFEYCIATSAANCTTWVSTGATRSVVVGGLSPNTTYYWQVRASNTYGTTYANGSDAAHWSFTTGTVPAAFSKTTPSSGQGGLGMNINLGWAGSTGATSYEYCIATSAAGCTTWINTGLLRSASLTGLSPSTMYFWHVRSVNSFGTTYANGSPTARWTFTTGNLPLTFNKASPTNGRVGMNPDVTLTWGWSGGAVSYEYCVGTSAATCTTWINTGATRSAVLTGLSSGTTFYWQVRGVNSFGQTYANGSPSAHWVFTTGAPPTAFNKTTPANSATGRAANTTLGWAGSSGATSYEYCLATSAAECTTWISTGLLRSASLTGLSPSTTYFWHVRANNSFGVTYANGAADAHWSFTTSSVPGAFSKAGPANGASNLSTSPTLSWGASSAAVSYEYCLGTSAATCTTWTSTGVSRSAALSGLNAGTTYYWQVRANNSFGTTDANGAGGHWSFTTAP